MRGAKPQPNATVTIREHHHYELVYTGVITTSIQQRQLQNPVTAPVGDLRSNLQVLLNTGDCEEYTTRLLAEAAKKFAGTYSHLKTIMEGFNKITSQGRFILKQVAYDTVDGDLFANGARPGAVWLVPNRQYGSMNPSQISFFQADYARTALHETFHLGKQGGYSDEQLAEAAYAVSGLELSTSKLTGDARMWHFSRVFDAELNKHCPRP